MIKDMDKDMDKDMIKDMNKDMINDMDKDMRRIKLRTRIRTWIRTWLMTWIRTWIMTWAQSWHKQGLGGKSYISESTQVTNRIMGRSCFAGVIIGGRGAGGEGIADARSARSRHWFGFTQASVWLRTAGNGEQFQTQGCVLHLLHVAGDLG